MGSLFAAYDPGAAGSPAEVAVVPLASEHLDRCAAIAAEREGGDPSRWRSSLERGLGRPDRRSWVGLLDGTVVAYASTAFLTPRHSDPDCLAPDGWYLTGVVVEPGSRRRGVGRALTTARLDWLDGRAATAWFFLSSENRASVDLHDAFGFRLVARDITFPGVSVTGSALLYAKDLTEVGAR